MPTARSFAPRRREAVVVLSLLGATCLVAAIVCMRRDAGVGAVIGLAVAGLLVMSLVRRPMMDVIAESAPPAGGPAKVYVLFVCAVFGLAGLLTAWSAATETNAMIWQAVGFVGGILALGTSYMFLIAFVVAMSRKR